MAMRTFRVLVTCTFLAAVASSAAGQCETWIPSGAEPSAVAGIAVIGHDPDGSGPLPERVVIAPKPVMTQRFFGHVTHTWQNDRWTTMGSPLVAPGEGAYELIYWQDDLYAVGILDWFDLNGIARWDGQNWAPALNGTPVRTYSAIVHNGELVIAGSIDGSSPYNGIARWDGSQWQPLGSGFSGQTISALGTYDGDLIAGGWFGWADGQPAHSLARWDGQAWHSMALGESTRHISAIAEFQGELYIAAQGIDFGGSEPANGIARWDGHAWRTVGGGVQGDPLGIRAMMVHENRLIVGGKFSRAGTIPSRNVAAWDGSSWIAMDLGGGSFNDQVDDLAIVNGELIATGTFQSSQGSGGGVSRWDGQRWRPMGPGFSGDHIDVVGQLNSDLIVSGQFTTVDETETNDEAVWGGSSWTAWSAPVSSITAFSSYQGSLAIASARTGPGGAERGVSLWDGVTLTPLGGKCNEPALVLTTYGDDLVAGGTFIRVGTLDVGHIARWNGTTWTSMGAAMNGTVRALVDTPDGLVAGGTFSQADGLNAANIARWDGDSWNALGPGFNSSVYALAEYNGDLIAAGGFVTSGAQTVNRIARWDGGAWQPLGGGLDGFVATIVVHNGELFVGGTFQNAGGVSAKRLAAWNGTSWRAVAGGCDDRVTTLAVHDDQLIVGGYFGSVGEDIPSNLFARLETCPSACPADLDGDGVVDFTDYLAFLNLFESQDPAADLNNDGVVDFGDYLEFLNHFDAGC